MLSILTLAYRGLSANQIETHETSEARHQHLFDTYVQKMLKRGTAAQLYSHEKTVEWLSWLAKGMFKHDQSMFLLERLQPDWLASVAQRRLHQGLFVIGVGILYALLFAMVILSNFSEEYRSYAFIGGLAAGLLLWPVVASGVYQTESGEILKWSWQQAVGELKSTIVYVLTFGVGIWAFVKITEWLGQLINWPLYWSSKYTDLNGLLLIELFAFGLYFILAGFRQSEIESTIMPNQGVRQSGRNALIAALITAFLTVILLVVIFDNLSASPDRHLARFLAFIIWGFVIFGGAYVINHYLLRFILYRDGRMPLKYVRFLDYAADQILLRKVGGGYMFIHRSLQEYFAALEE